MRDSMRAAAFALTLTFGPACPQDTPPSLSVHISSPPPLARTPLGPKQLCNQIVAVEAESSLALAGVELSIGSTEQIPTVLRMCHGRAGVNATVKTMHPNAVQCLRHIGPVR